jgi:hypothetical protein
MGISLHDALRAFQRCDIHLLGRTFQLLNSDEGQLTIWCPDERADFMNHEKSEYLRRLESESPKLTRLRTYINRQQRDPGALQDAVACGGYFFPTNPQSPDELRNLLYSALRERASLLGCDAAALLADAEVQATLRSLGCTYSDSGVVVERGVEGGLGGLMIPYLLMLEELATRSSTRALSVWNQASIGAALAAAVLADRAIRSTNDLSETTRFELDSRFPGARRTFDVGRGKREFQTRVHGVFDLANIQSLAQLLGVVVDGHVSGKGTAFVGLGSASYSNGNRCFEILRDDCLTHGPFRGRDNFHPATHTVNPVAQALVFGEEVDRVLASTAEDSVSILDLVTSHCRKPEPAGAAAVAGYLLTRLDAGTLSTVQIARSLRDLGFDRLTFLGFSGYDESNDGEERFVREAQEEGPRMMGFAQDLTVLLDWPYSMLAEKDRAEGEESRRADFLNPIDPPRIEALNPLVVLYLTGDNTEQPERELVARIIRNRVRPGQRQGLRDSCRHESGEREANRIHKVDTAFSGMASTVQILGIAVESARWRVLKRLSQRIGQ